MLTRKCKLRLTMDQIGGTGSQEWGRTTREACTLGTEVLRTLRMTYFCTYGRTMSSVHLPSSPRTVSTIDAVLQYPRLTVLVESLGRKSISTHCSTYMSSAFYVRPITSQYGSTECRSTPVQYMLVRKYVPSRFPVRVTYLCTPPRPHVPRRVKLVPKRSFSCAHSAA